MPEQRRRFSPQFKAEAVQMVIETGKPIAEVARDLGIHDGTLGNWVNTWRREHPEPVGAREHPDASATSAGGHTQSSTLWTNASDQSRRAGQRQPLS
jgi:transposase-like protein